MTTPHRDLDQLARIVGDRLDLRERLPRPPRWMRGALCAQIGPGDTTDEHGSVTGTFFPARGKSTRDAKRICGMCEVADECRAYAITHDELVGVWGGLSERERRRMRRVP